jgi:hypothetical protein
MTHHDLIGTAYLQDINIDYLMNGLAVYNQRIMGPTARGKRGGHGLPHSTDPNVVRPTWRSRSTSAPQPPTPAPGSSVTSRPYHGALRAAGPDTRAGVAGQPVE